MMPPPGTRLLRLARAWFDEATVANVFEPLIADWQRESGALTNARDRSLLNARWYLAFVLTLLLSTARTACVLPHPRVGLVFVVGALGTTVVGATVMLWFVVPQLMALEASPLVLAGAVTGAIAWFSMVLLPLGALPASMLARHTGASRADVTRLSGVLLIAVVMSVMWIGPYGERTRALAQEDLLLPSWVARGMTEAEARAALRASRIRSADLTMSVPELLRAQTAGVAEPLSPGRVTTELHRRVALVGLTLLMTSLGWRLAARRPRHVGLSVVAWWAGTAVLLLGCWFVAMRAAAFGAIASWMTPWATLAVATGLAWLVTRGHRQTTRNAVTPVST